MSMSVGADGVMCGSDRISLLTKTVLLMFIFSSSTFCILYCDRWISLVWLDWRVTIGNLSLALDKKVQFNEVLVPFRGHVSVSVRLPSNWKLKSSKRASVEGEDVALTEL